MTDVKPTDHFPNIFENQHSGHFDDEDRQFDLRFSFDELFADEHGIIGDESASGRKHGRVAVEVSYCQRAVNQESGDSSFESLLGDCSRSAGDVSRATPSEGSANGASGSVATEASDLKIKVEAKSMSKRKNESAEEDEKRKKSRLMRNRESAQMSRERKKHYVEELEGKIRAMHSTIADLNCKFAYFMAENASLRQRIGCVVSPTPVPHPVPLCYSWMPSLPYAMNGSQANVLPIVSTKHQKAEVRTKSVASISLLGLLVFLFLFGGLVPMVNIKYGGTATSRHWDRVFTDNVDAYGHGNRIEMEYDVSKEMYMYDDYDDYSNNVEGKQEATAESGKSGKDGSSSQLLVATLYVPRNDKLVKIDGSLIIPSVPANEKAMTSHEASSLAVAQNVAPVQAYRNQNERQEPLADSSKASADDPRQWYREGAPGPKLSSASCTEVFQFDGSAEANTRAVVPADYQSHSTRLSETTHTKNPQSLPKTANMKEKHMETNNTKNSINSNKSTMVVSVHMNDAKEALNSKGSDGIMGSTSKVLPRIHVVVLLERVTYVTYSCVLPVVKGSIPGPART